MALSEIKRRQQYLDNMTEEALVLRPLVIECLDDDPVIRPTIKTICERIKVSKNAYVKDLPLESFTLYCENQQLKTKNQQLNTVNQQVKTENELLNTENQQLKLNIMQQSIKNDKLRKENDQLRKENVQKDTAIHLIRMVI